VVEGSILDVADVVVVEEDVTGQRAVLEVGLEQLGDVVDRHLTVATPGENG